MLGIPGEMQEPLGRDFGKRLLPRGIVEKIEGEDMHTARPFEIDLSAPCERIDFASAIEQGLQRMPSDIARGAGDEDFHSVAFSGRWC
jgi:hypothetical protein